MTLRDGVFALLFFILGTVSIGIAHAAWSEPSDTPPNANVAAPINVGSTPQVKNGGLGVNTLSVFGNSLFGGSTGSNAYLNFGDTSGNNGYGIRDNAGLLEFKNSGGSWESLQSTIFNLVGGAGSWGASGNDIYSTNSGNVGIGDTSPNTKLSVQGAVKFGNTSSTCNSTHEGEQRYNSTTKSMEFCNGTSWKSYGGGTRSCHWVYSNQNCVTNPTHHTASCNPGEYVNAVQTVQICWTNDNTYTTVSDLYCCKD